MGKTITLKQLSEKKYTLVKDLSVDLQNSIGEIEDAFDAIIYGASGNGKSNFTVMLLKSLVLAMDCKCEYVSYEEGHGKTFQDTIIARHDMYKIIGNKMLLTDHLTYDELYKRMGRKQSAKIWVIDSIQAARFTAEQCAELKTKYVLGKKKKIIIYISWSEGKFPQGAVAKGIEYYANIKMRVEGLVMFPKSRYGGNKPFVIWEGNETEGAMRYWGKDYWKITGKQKPTKAKSTKQSKENNDNGQQQIDTGGEIPIEAVA